jgi:hypothetical protein
MSEVTQYSRSRNDLYEKYKETDPGLAENFLGSEHSLSISSLPILPTLGRAFLAAAIITSITVISLLAGVTQGFGPSPNPTFYSTMFPAIGGTCGPFAAAGLIMLAVWYCKRRNILAEQLPVKEINRIRQNFSGSNSETHKLNIQEAF